MKGPPRIAVTCAGNPGNPAAYSGIPHSVLQALGELDVDAVPVAGAPGPAARKWLAPLLLVSLLRPRDLVRVNEVRRHLPAVVMSPLMPRIRAWSAAKAFRAAGSFDGAVQYGSAFDLPDRLPFVTLEDATFKQVAAAYDWPWLARVSDERVAREVRKHSRRYARARACAFTSHWAARSAVDDLGLPPEKVHVVGVGRNHNPPCPEDRQWDAPRALFIGFDWERKNGPAVLRAFAELRREHPRAQLDVVGGHPRIEMPGVTGHGRLSLAHPVERERIEALLAQATFFVMPSLHEPAGIVYAEAQAAGIASIGTTSGGARTIIGNAGMVIDPGDPAALVAAMQALARPEVAQQLGARARARAPLFTWRAVAERLLRVLALPGHETSAFATPLALEP